MKQTFYIFVYILNININIKVMPKSKNRKNHKKKTQQRNENIRSQRKKSIQFQQRLFEQFQLQQEIGKRERIIETIYRNRPEIAKENENGKLVYNDEILEYKEDGVLYWKENENPLLAGLEALENYEIYTEELVNQFLQNIQYRDNIKKQQVEQSGLETEIVEDLNAELGLNDDFELELDEDFTEFETVNTDSDSDSDTKNDTVNLIPNSKK